MAIALAVALLALQLAAVSTEAVNWDEVALFQRTERSLATGRLDGGGRPGLALFVLMPFVEGCRDAVAAVRQARYLWVFVTAAYVAAVFALIARLGPRRPGWWQGPALAAGALVLVPAFLRWSVQVRTDQLALAFSLWGGVALLASSRARLRWAACAGLLTALGYLASQKALYAAALSALLAAGDLWLAGRLFDRTAIRDLAFRLAVAASLGVAVVVAWRVVVPRFFSLNPAYTLERSLGLFDFYRDAVGAGPYLRMLPSLAPHGVLLALMLAASVRAVRQRHENGWDDAARRLALGWACLALGTAVALFHAAAFPYFWMTLGLFPALTLGLAREPILGLFPAGAWRRAAAAGAWLLLLAASAPAALARLDDRQAVQRDSLALVEGSFLPSARGFQAEGALFCRPDPEPFPRLLSQTIAANFYGPGSEPRVAAFLDEFRKRPVAFVVTSYRMQQFPPVVQSFWRRHYVAYRDAVLVPGQLLPLAAGSSRDFELLAAGEYRLHATAGAGDGVEIDGRSLPLGGTLRLEAGAHRARGFGGRGQALLAPGLRLPPGEARSFYDAEQIADIRGYP